MNYLYYKSIGDSEWTIYNIYDTEDAARIDGRILWKKNSVIAIKIDTVITVVEHSK
jgi:hypothetical protein